MVGKRRKITKEMFEKMVKMRKEGASYSKICSVLGISKWSCIHYLRGVEPEKSYVEVAWKKAEREAIDYLRSAGFDEVHNLNRLCPSPYWDLLARRDGEWWLVDVTISEGKKIGSKIPYIVEGYETAILYRDLNGGGWRLVKINITEVND